MKTYRAGRRALEAAIASLGTAALVFVAGVGVAAEPLATPPLTPLVSPVVTPTAPSAPATAPVTTTTASKPTANLGGTALVAAAAAPTTLVAGRTPATFAVSNSGAATYTIPLWMPPGIGSLQLSLSLTYNSRAANGVLGQGWALAGLSSITRCNKSWAQDGAPAAVTNTLVDRFCLDGQQLKLTSTAGTYGQAGSTYATEIESFSKIQAGATSVGNGPGSFTVTTKNGLIYDYGTTADSQIFAGSSGTIRTWALSRIRDRVGNAIAITYTNDSVNGSYRVSQITYPTTSTGQGPFYTVSFSYSARAATDPVSAYLAGNLSQELNRLDSITATPYGSAAVIKAYYLGYSQAATTGRTLLASVQECGASTCFPASTFTYQAGSPGWPAAPTALGVSTANVGRVIPADLNGDGISDLLYPTTSGTNYAWNTRLGNASGTFAAAQSVGVTTTPGTAFTVGDFLGRGQSDVLYPSGGTWFRLYWNGSAFATASTGIAVVTSVGDSSGATAADVDGDGLPDLLFTVNNDIGGSSKLYLMRNTTSGGVLSFAAPAVAYTLPRNTGSCADNPRCNNYYFIGTSNSPYSSDIVGADFNGDGRQDLYLRIEHDTATTQSYSWRILISGGTSFTLASEFGTSFSSLSQLLIDWNGDGCTDLVDPGPLTTGNYTIYLSACGASGGFTNPINTSISNLTPLLALDWDGDGRQDLLAATGSTWKVLRSNGTGINGTAIDTGITSTSAAWQVGDFDGDGLNDLLALAQSGGAMSAALHNGQGLSPDLATSFTDGFGIAQNPTYVSLARNNYSKYSDAVFPEADFSGSLPVVDQFTASDGTGSTYQNQFWYYGARVQLQGRGFEGFYAQRIYDTRTGFITYDYVQRQFPYTGMFSQQSVQNGGGTQNIYFLTTTPSYQISGGSGYEQRWFPFIASQTDSQYEYGGTQNGNLITQRQTSLTYGDAYGNPTSIVTTTTDKDSGSSFYNSSWTTTTSNGFANNPTNWCYGMPAWTTVQNAAPGQTTQTRTYNYTVDVGYCRVTQQVLEPSNAAQIVTTTLGFDPAACGNVSSVQVQGANSDGSAMTARTTSFGYGSRCQLPQTVTNALGQASSIAYDYSFGVPTSVSDPNGIATTWQLDEYGRRRVETRPDGTYTGFEYLYCTTTPCWGVNDLRFLVNQYEYASGGAWIKTRQLFFDGMDRLRYDEWYRLGGTWTVDIRLFDSLGRQVTYYLPGNYGANGRWDTSYDPLGRPTQRRLYQGSGTLDRTVNLAYAGRSTSVTDALSHTRTRVADVLGRLRRVIDPSPGGTTYYDYDAFGNLNRIQDPQGGVSSGTYNLRGFRTQWTDADAGTWNYSGDSLNELTSWSDAKGQSFSATYDSLGRLTSRAEPEGTSTFAFGASAAAHNIGRLASVSGLGYSESLSYDGIGRLSNRSITLDQNYQYDYTYNSIGETDTITYPASPTSAGQTAARFKIQYLYSYGYLQQIKDANTGGTLYYLSSTNDYDSPTGESLGNGVTITSGYKPWTNELTSVSSVNGAVGKQNLSYTWDTAGNLTQRADVIRSLTENFGYDTLDRLTSVTGTTALSVGYDANGNITTKSDVGTYTYGIAGKPNRLTSAGGSALSYDANGNVTSRGSGKSLTFASFNLPSLVTDGSLQTTYSYGPDHQRVQSFGTYSDGTATTRYIGGLLEKVAPSGSAEEWRHYVPTPSGEIVVRRWASSNDTRYVLTDHLGSSDVVLDASSNVVLAESFDAFGKRRNGATWGGAPPLADKTQIASTTRDGFTGHEMIDTVGLIHMGGRVYDPGLGRFLSADPVIGDLSDSQQVAPYAYAGGRTLSAVDLTGLSVERPGDLVGTVRDFGSQNYYKGVADLVVDIVFYLGIFGHHKPPPPPPIALPGVSAQTGTGLCGSGSASSTCGGLVLYQTASIPIEGIPGFPPIPYTPPGSPFYEAFSKWIQYEQTYGMLSRPPKVKTATPPPVTAPRAAAGGNASDPDPDDERNVSRERGTRERGTRDADSIEEHHDLPREFDAQFRRAGLDIEKYTVRLTRAAHRLKPDGLHTRSVNWNAQWRQFFRANPTATREQILAQLERMRRAVGR